MAAEFRIAVDINIPEGSPLNAGSFPNVAGAFRALAQAAHERWVEYAHGMPLPGGQVIHPRSGSYARSIAIREHGDFDKEIYSDLPYATAIEYGSPARDLHDMLRTSRKTRVSKKGKRYLIVPFRWGTPGTQGFGKNTMPMEVHRGWLKGDFGGSSKIVGVGTRISGSGHVVRQRHYAWGGRLSQGDLDKLGIGTSFHGKTYRRHPMAGMVQMRRGSSQRGQKHTQYLTFRVISEGSPGWIVPPIEGKYPARTTSEQIRPIAEKVLRDAAEKDVRAILAGGT
jgi:hypothetical protein